MGDLTVLARNGANLPPVEDKRQNAHLLAECPAQMPAHGYKLCRFGRSGGDMAVVRPQHDSLVRKRFLSQPLNVLGHRPVASIVELLPVPYFHIVFTLPTPI